MNDSVANFHDNDIESSDAKLPQTKLSIAEIHKEIFDGKIVKVDSRSLHFDFRIKFTCQEQ